MFRQEVVNNNMNEKVQQDFTVLTRIDVVPPENDIASTENISEATAENEGIQNVFNTLNLNELERDSSASSRTCEGTSRSHSSSSISSSNSGWSSVPNYELSNQLRSPVMSEDIPPLDPTILTDLENKAKALSENLEHVNQNFAAHLHNMAESSTNCLSIFKESVDSSCDSVDSSIKSMYALMAKCEELGRVVQPVYGIQDQIKEIKRLLDVFEKQLSDEEC